MSSRVAASSNAPCSITVHPATTDLLALSGPCACTAERSPLAAASPHAARSCSSVIVGVPPTRMLAEAKILMTSAPSAASRRTSRRISLGSPLRTWIDCSEVRIRGPGILPRAIQFRRSASSREPRFCTVVIPPIKVMYAFSTA